MKAFKQIVVIFICLQVTVPYMVVNIVRVPALISHFLHHSGVSNFSAFIRDHHSGTQRQKDDSGHHNLPFHKHYDGFNYQITAIIFEHRVFHFNALNQFKSERVKVPVIQNIVPLTISLTVWRPPRVV